MVFGNNWSYFIHNFFDIRQISDGSSELFFSTKKKERVWGELKMHYESNKFHSCLCNPPLTIVILLSSDFFHLLSVLIVQFFLCFLLSLLVHHLLSLLAVNLSKSLQQQSGPTSEMSWQENINFSHASVNWCWILLSTRLVDCLICCRPVVSTSNRT